MKVKLSFKDKTYKYITSATKRKVAAGLTNLHGQNALFVGTCVVEYDKDFTNSFDFDSESDLRTKLWPCLEPELLKEFAQ